MLAPVVVAAVTVVVIVEVVALQFPVFSLFSLLLFRYLLPPPPPTARPPASALHHLASREAHLRRPVRTTALGKDGDSVGSFRPGTVEGSLEGASALASVRQAGGVAAGRGGDLAFFFSSAAADAAAVRETEPSMGPQPLERVHKLALSRERAALI